MQSKTSEKERYLEQPKKKSMSTVIRGKLESVTDQTLYQPSEPLLLLFSHSVQVQLCVTPWTIAHQAPLSMGFPRQEYWSGLLFPPPGYLPDRDGTRVS